MLEKKPKRYRYPVELPSVEWQLPGCFGAFIVSWDRCQLWNDKKEGQRQFNFELDCNLFTGRTRC